MRRVKKVRGKITYWGHTLEIDVYLDRDLIVAEIEVRNLSDIANLIPLGKYITNYPTYKNKNLAKRANF